MLRNLAPESVTGPPHQLGLASTVKVWLGVHSTNLNGPVPFGLSTTDPSAIAALDTMPRLSEVRPYSSDESGTFSVKTTSLAPDALTSATLARNDAEASAVAGSWTRFIDATT